MPPEIERQCFRTALERGAGSLGWTVAFVPFSARQLWPHMIRQRVAGEPNGIAFRSSLFPDSASSRSFLLVNSTLQKLSKTTIGSLVSITLWPDLEERAAMLPDELAEILAEEPGLRTWYQELSPAMRREMGKWIEGARGEQTRVRRALAMAERLLAAKEAEESLPPLLQRAFGARPQAARGWQLLTQHQRRAELLAVFLYQSPEARQRRVQKLCTLAAARAQKDVG